MFVNGSQNRRKVKTLKDTNTLIRNSAYRLIIKHMFVNRNIEKYSHTCRLIYRSQTHGEKEHFTRHASGITSQNLSLIKSHRINATNQFDTF